jgi:glycine amidinotransferase
MIFTEYDKLQEIIVGDSYLPGDLDNFLPQPCLKKFNLILEETKQDLDALAKFFIDSNIKVLRPTVLRYDTPVIIGDLKISVPMCPIVPRDQYFVMDNTFSQTYTSYSDRYLDVLCYKQIFNYFAEQNYQIHCQPTPQLRNITAEESWFISDKIYKDTYKEQLLWHTATMYKLGDSIIVNSAGPGTQLGYEWIKKIYASYKFIPNLPENIFKNYGHIDHGFFMLDDDTVVHCGLKWVPTILQNKKLIDISQYVSEVYIDNYVKDYVSTDGKYSELWLEKYLSNWRGYNQEVCFDLNVVVLDSKNVLFGRHIPELFKYLKTLGIECHMVNQRHQVYWEGGIHCFTLDTKRKGTKRQIV